MKKNILINFLYICLLILCFTFANITTITFIVSLKFIINVIVPTLFPFMIFVNFVLLSNCLDYFAVCISKLSKYIHISGYGILTLFASLIGGYPYSSIFIKSLISDNKIDKKEGEIIAKYSFFPSISFILSALYNKNNMILLIISIIYFVSFIGIFIENRNVKNNNIDIAISKSPSVLFYDVMNTTFKSIFTIAFCIIFFRLLGSYLSLLIKDEQMLLLINGLLEFSYSSIALASKETICFFDYILLTFILGFSSLSILMQSYFYLKDINVSFKKLLAYRLIVASSSVVIFIIIFFLIH